MNNCVPKKRIGLLVETVSVILVAGLCSLAHGSTLAGWTRDLTRGGTMADYPGVPLVLLLTSSVGGQLSASCGYRYLDRIGSAELHGKFGSDGLFRPVVKYEVATAPNKWNTVGQSAKPSDSVAIKVDSATPYAMLQIDMDPFRPMLAKYRWGRIVLENGESTTFPLDDLLPTGDNPNDTDFKAAVNDENPDRFGSSFRLVAVISLSGHLTGEFALIPGEKRRVGELAGRRDSDGAFLPVVTLQAGNSDHEWRTLEEPEKVQAPTALRLSDDNPAQTIRVGLDSYTTLIGKSKYAKVVFSNGDFSVFELDRLKPPFMRSPLVPE
jgi:hypothetical protein